MMILMMEEKKVCKGGNSGKPEQAGTTNDPKIPKGFKLIGTYMAQSPDPVAMSSTL